MKTRNSVRGLLLGLLVLALALAGCAPAATPTTAPAATSAPVATTAPEPTAAVAAPALDVEAVLDQYLTMLPDGFGGIKADALKEQIAAAAPFLLDVREAKELTDNGYIEGAVNVPLRTLAQNLDLLPAQDAAIVVYCGTGHRSAIAMEALQLLGYTNVKSLGGGFNAWKAANLPVATAEIAAPMAGSAPEVDEELLAVLDQYLTMLPDGFGGIKADALKEQIAAAAPFLLDVREAKELTDNGYIEGAVNVPLRTLAQNLDLLPAQDAAIVVYCGTGHRSAIAMEALQLLGYTNVKSLGGGFNAWKAANPTLDLPKVLDTYLTTLPDGFSGIKPDVLNEQLAAAAPFLVDVREPKELTDNGYIEGAVNIPIRTLTQNLDKLPAKDAAIVVYCAVGHRGALAMEALQLLGYTNVKSLSGGFNAWKAANLPVATAEIAAPMAGAAPDVDKELLAALDKSGLGSGRRGPPHCEAARFVRRHDHPVAE